VKHLRMRAASAAVILPSRRAGNACARPLSFTVRHPLRSVVPWSRPTDSATSHFHH
jgi:hypothetical protein